jgi:hypothetical protein
MGELTLAQAAARVKVSRTFDPVPGEREVYQDHFREYKKLYGSLKGFYHRLNG